MSPKVSCCRLPVPLPHVPRYTGQTAEQSRVQALESRLRSRPRAVEPLTKPWFLHVKIRMIIVPTSWVGVVD